MATQTKRTLPHGWLPAAGLAVLIGITYARSLTVPFLFDDAGAVVNNPTIRNLWSLAALHPPADGSTTTHRPVVNLSFAINHAISGDQPWSYHALNLAIHFGAALILMGIVRRLISVASAPSDWAKSQSRSMAFFSAALWALHPLQSESVVCIAQRTESLCGLFYLLTLFAFLRAVQSENETGGVRRAWLVVSVAAALAGMGTKEVMVTAPLLVLLADRTFVAGSFRAALGGRPWFYTALAGTWLVLVFLAVGGGGARGVSAGFGLGVTARSYALKQTEALGLYLKLAWWPHPLVLDYGTAVTNSAADVAWQGLVVLALIGATMWALARKPRVGFAWAWFFLILAPSSSIVPLVTQTMAEHRMYLPLAAIVVLGVTGAHVLLGPRAAWPLILGSLFLGGITRARVDVYRDPLSIWADSVAHYPSSARAHNNLALVLQQRGRSAEANAEFARAIELQPGYLWAHYNWGVALLEQGKFAEAAAEVDAAVRIAPAFERDPRMAETQFQLGRLAERSGRPADAEARYGEALRLAPDNAEAHAKLGLLLARTRRLDAAARHFEAVIRLQPDNADAHANLGNVLLLLERPREALASYEIALRLRPGDSRLRESVELARQALR